MDVPLALPKQCGWLLVVAILTACGESKPPERYEIPDGYRGWVEIRVKRAGCPPLKQVSNETMYVISPDGTLCTSSPLPSGMGYETYCYAKNGRCAPLPSVPNDPSSMIWGKEYYSTDAGPDVESQRDRLRFFVGTRREYENARRR